MAMQKVMMAHQPRRLSGRAYTKERRLMHSPPYSVTRSSYALIWQTSYEHHATTCCHLNVSLLDKGQVRHPRHFRGSCVHIRTSVADVFLSRGRRARSQTCKEKSPAVTPGLAFCLPLELILFTFRTDPRWPAPTARRPRSVRRRGILGDLVCPQGLDIWQCSDRACDYPSVLLGTARLRRPPDVRSDWLAGPCCLLFASPQLASLINRAARIATSKTATVESPATARGSVQINDSAEPSNRHRHRWQTKYMASITTVVMKAVRPTRIIGNRPVQGALSVPRPFIRATPIHALENRLIAPGLGIRFALNVAWVPWGRRQNVAGLRHVRGR